MEHLKAAIRTIPDFPKPGIQFLDIAPLLANPKHFRAIIDQFKERHADSGIDVVVGIEARGFIFASALAYALSAGTCMVRKPGKLPHTTHQQSYDLEYGTDAVEIHTDALESGQKILLVDDVLATGGTVAATAALIRNNFEVELVEVDFLIELGFLKGREKLSGLPVYAMIKY